MENQTTLNEKSLVFFAANLGKELNRFNSKGEFINTVEVTEDNILNLRDSQFKNKTKYGETFFYSLYAT